MGMWEEVSVQDCRNSANHRVLRLSALDSLHCFYLGETCELLVRRVIRYIIPGLYTQRKRQWSPHDITKGSVQGTGHLLFSSKGWRQVMIQMMVKEWLRTCRDWLPGNTKSTKNWCHSNSPHIDSLLKMLASEVRH